MSLDYVTDVTVLGGLPITVAFSVSAAEPDIGVPEGVDDWEICAVNGRQSKRPTWIERRLTREDIAQLENDLFQAYCEGRA